MVRPKLVSGAPSKAPLDACLHDLQQDRPGCLAIVLDISGHAYAKPGILVHVAANGLRAGWVSAGCLEGEVQEAASLSLADGRARLLNLDNRDLSDILFSGAGAGCRGRQLVLMLPLAQLPGVAPILMAYRQHAEPMQLQYQQSGALLLQSGGLRGEWQLPPVILGATADTTDATAWALQWAALPRALILGCGPESEFLLPILNQLGWRMDLVEPRRAWSGLAGLAEKHLKVPPSAEESPCYDAALIMAHHFGNDCAALAALAEWPVLPRYIGLLGPRTRMRDLLETLPASVHTRLAERVEAPAGLPLGGQGAAAIALSLAARLQSLASAAGP